MGAPSDLVDVAKDKQQAPEADGHGHDHGHGHHKLTPDELNWRCKIFLTLEEPDFSFTARLVSAFLNACLFLSVIAFIMGTMPSFKHAPYHCHPHMVVGYTCWDGYGHATKVTPVDPHQPEQFEAAHAEYLEYKRKKKEKEALGKKGGDGKGSDGKGSDGKGGDPKDPKAAAAGGGDQGGGGAPLPLLRGA